MAIPLIGPDGREYEIDEGDQATLDDVLSRGFRVETAEKPRTTRDVVNAGVNEVVDTSEAAFRGFTKGATFGLGDVAERAIAGDDKQGWADAQASRKRLSEKSPIATGAGEVAGMVLSPVNKIGAAIKGGIGATTALGRVGSAMVGEGVEGVLWGAGNALSDAAIGDSELTAEHMIGEVGLGGLLGAAGGGIGHGLAEGLKKAGSSMFKAIGKAEDPLMDLRDVFGLKAAGAMGKDFKAAEHRGNARELVDLLIEKKILKPGGTVESVADQAGALRQEVGALKGSLVDALEAKGAVVDGQKVARELEDMAQKYLNGSVGDQAIGKRLMAEAEVIQAKGQMKFRDAENYKTELDKFLKFGAEQGPMQEGLKSMRKLLNGEIEAAAKKTGLPEVDQWMKAKKEYGILDQVDEFATARAQQLKANNVLSLTDRMAGGFGIVGGAGLGGFGSGSLEGAAVGAMAGLGNKVARERLPALIALAIDKIAKSPKLMLTAAAFGDKIAAASTSMGDLAAPVLQAYADSPEAGLATHIAESQTNPEYAEAAKMAGFLPETAEENAHVQAKGDSLAAIEHTVAAQSKKIGSQLNAVFKGERKAADSSAVHQSQDFGSRRMRAKDSTAAHQKRVKEFRELSSNPEALLDRVTANVGEVSRMAPNVGAAMTNAAYRAVSYLTKESQEPPKAGPLAMDWRPNEAEVHAFSQKLEVIERPMSVLDHAASGTLVPAQWEAVQAVYPALAKQIQDMAIERLTDPPKDVPYRSRMMLSIITGLDVDGTMGMGIALNQEAINAASAVEKPMGAESGTKGKLSLGSMAATRSQKRELDDEKQA